MDLSAILGRERVRDLCCGAYNCFVITSSRNVVGWGLNNSGQLSLPSEHESDFVCWRPRRLERLTDIKTLAGGSQQTLALARDGR